MGRSSFAAPPILLPLPGYPAIRREMFCADRHIKLTRVTTRVALSQTARQRTRAGSLITAAAPSVNGEQAQQTINSYFAGVC